MPETTMKPSRKHGLGAKTSKAMASSAASRVSSNHSAPLGSGRIQTSVTLASHRQAYHWFTDRGRSRVLIRF